MQNMNKELQKHILKAKFGENSDLIDFDSHIDSSLTLTEQINEISRKFPNFQGETEVNLDKLMNEAKEFESMQMEQMNKSIVWKEGEIFKTDFIDIHNLSKVKTIAIYGRTGSGKTALIFKIIEEFDKPVYFYQYPRPELLIKFGYKRIDSIEDFERLRNCILVLDEPQLYFSIYDKKSNEVIARLCSMARQFNVTLVIASSDTRIFSRHNESYFDLWMVKDLDYDMVKNGSKIKAIIKKNTLFQPSGFKLNKNEFVSECRDLSEFNGKHTFDLPKYWNDKISKPYY